MFHPKIYPPYYYSLPMICEPEKWSEGKFGFDLENKYLKNDIILSSSSHKHNMENKDSLYNAINYFNSIQFTRNKIKNLRVTQSFLFF